ncbi:MAG: hypothetical protein F4Y41_21090 [Gammaproteobacteria bacterium]|nr:hypothetical protein [Gammaproteobacteria bacterium]MYF30286.1 hypothetical protein [Gammaproteobacteria bacterium]
MTTLRADPAMDPDDPSHASLLASDPVDWARCATLLVYERHAATLANRAERRARRLAAGGDRSTAETVRRDAVNDLRHSCTNYEELVADVAAHYGHGRRDDVIDVLRNRALRALAHRFPSLSDVCLMIADERRSAA